jgi:hypothetical protein
LSVLVDTGVALAFSKIRDPSHTGGTATWMEIHRSRRENAMNKAIIGVVLAFALLVSVFVELNAYTEVVSMAAIADTSTDAGPPF